jgi:hypothetical protein
MEAFEKTLFDALMDVMDEAWKNVELEACDAAAERAAPPDRARRLSHCLHP